MTNDLANFFNEIKKAFQANKPLVVYRKPNENLLVALVQINNDLNELTSFNQTGFVFAPFTNIEKKVFFSKEESTYFSAKITEDFVLKEEANEIRFKPTLNEDELKEKHINLVEKAVDFIKSDKAQKIVLSRTETLKCNEFEIFKTLQKMLNYYPNAFVYLWYHPKVGLWMGATPERLIEINNNQFKTMALAGTQQYKGSTNVIWKDKEKEEQQFVTDFILSNLKDTINSIKISEPYAVKAGNLVHIRTDISGKLKFDNSLEKLVTIIHPTPAVCGLPKDVATNFILENEGYNRSYYSGYLGELNIENSTNLFVNLRCMQIYNNNAILYIGGGITSESNPVKEWEETVSKAEVMKKVL